MMAASTTTTDDQQAHGAALRTRFENLLNWLHLELKRPQIDAENTYDQAAKLLAVVAEMRFTTPGALQRMPSPNVEEPQDAS